MKKKEFSVEKNPKKYLSRKFVVWLMATAVMIFTLIIAFKNSDTSLPIAFMPWWGSISVVYIGGNVAQDFAVLKKKVE